MRSICSILSLYQRIARSCIRVLLVGFLLMFTVSLSASDNLVSGVETEKTAITVLPEDTFKSEEKSNYSALLLQMLFGLSLVLIIIFATAWILRRVGYTQLFHSSAMKIVSSLSLGARDRVIVIEVGGKQILLAVSPGKIETLYVFESPAVESSSSEFEKKFRQVLHRRTAE